MENAPTGHADDLPRILGIFRNYSKSRSVNIFVQQLDFTPNCIEDFIYQPKLRPDVNFGPVKGFWLDGTPRKLHSDCGCCRSPALNCGGLPPPQTPGIS